VTLHHQMLTTLARALQGLGMGARAQPLQAEAVAVAADFQRLLVADGVVTGYALFEAPAAAAPPPLPKLLLHPQDHLTGLRYSLLPMMHAILEDLLSPAQAQAARQLVDAHLMGPDGARLFDRPLPYRGGPETLFQRAESSAFFGREIGVMYMHAHLRWAETLAHLGVADALFAALARAHPIALRDWVPSAGLRQANCYFSSSDAAFADRYEAERDYARVARGEVALDGGWRVYSSGPGIALGLIVSRFLGVRREHDRLVLDPVIAPALDGLVARVPLGGVELEIEYRLGPQGCGPRALTLGGTPLAFARGANPYRTGAAEVVLADLQPRLAAGARRLVVQTA
jgi:CRISPR-associated protein Csx3